MDTHLDTFRSPRNFMIAVQNAGKETKKVVRGLQRLVNSVEHWTKGNAVTYHICSGEKKKRKEYETSSALCSDKAKCVYVRKAI